MFSTIEMHPQLSEFYYEAKDYFPRGDEDDEDDRLRNLSAEDEIADLKKYHLVEACVPQVDNCFEKGFMVVVVG